MSQSAESITSRIHAKSDGILKKRIKAAVDAFKTELTNLGGGAYFLTVPVHKSRLRDLVDPIPENIGVPLDNLLERLPEVAFDVARDANRTAAVDAYMKRVEDLSHQVEGLGERINELNPQ